MAFFSAETRRPSFCFAIHNFPFCTLRDFKQQPFNDFHRHSSNVGGVGWKELKLAEQQIRNIDSAAERHEYLTYANSSTLNLKAFQQQTILELEL